MIPHPINNPTAWPVLNHFTLQRHPAELCGSARSRDSQAVADHLIEPPLVVASWYLGVGFTSRASDGTTYSTAHRAGLVCTMMIVFEYRVGPVPLLLCFKQREPHLTASIQLCRKVLSCVIRCIALFWRSPRLCRHKTTSLFTTVRPDRKPMTHSLPPLLTPSLLSLHVAGLTS